MTDDAPDGVFTPDELVPNDDRLRELDGGRYVVSLDDQDGVARDRVTATESTGGRSSGSDGPPGAGGEGTSAESGPREDATLPDGTYSLSVLAEFEGASHSLSTGSDNVAVTFETLLRWYVGAVAPGVPIEEALPILFSNTDFDLDVHTSARTGE